MIMHKVYGLFDKHQASSKNGIYNFSNTSSSISAGLQIQQVFFT